MKILFLSLLLLNAGYLGYNIWSAQSDGREAEAGEDAVAPLRLVDEPAEPASTAEEGAVAEIAEAEDRDEQEAPETREAESTAQCHIIGPLPSTDQREHIRDEAAEQGLRVVDHWSEETEMPRYWVHIPPADDMGGARATLQRLEEHGIEDIQLINSGRMARGISLGLFSTREGAERRETRVRVQGFDTGIDEVAVQAVGHWVAVRQEGGEAVERSLLDSITRGVEGADVTQRPCEDIAP